MAIRRMNVGGLRPGAVLTGGVASAGLFIVARSVPELGLLALVSALPLGVARLLAGRGSGLAGCVVAASIVGALEGWLVALAFLVVMAAPVLVLSEALAEGRGAPQAMLWGFAWTGSVAALALVQPGANWSELATEPLRHYQSPEFLDEVRGRGVPEEQVEVLSEQFATLERVIAVIYPAAFLIMAGLAVVVNTALLRGQLARFRPELAGRGFEELRLPLGVAVAFVASGAALVSPPLRPLAYNLLALVAFLYLLQGLAVVVYFVSRFRGPRLLRAAIVVLLLMIPVGIHVVPLLGLFDTWFDFRRWAPRPERGDHGGGTDGDSGQRE
jgi:uncharacterized protein YybS (DUF2232 family)